MGPHSFIKYFTLGLCIANLSKAEKMLALKQRSNNSMPSHPGSIRKECFPLSHVLKRRTVSQKKRMLFSDSFKNKPTFDKFKAFVHVSVTS